MTHSSVEVEKLFHVIPKAFFRKTMDKDDSLSEMELVELNEKIGQKNQHLSFKSYLGGGAYEHYIPKVISHLSHKSEFLTSYTPYQAEASQGILELLYDYQEFIKDLTGLELSQASLYDGSHAVLEAVLMMTRFHKKTKVFIEEGVNPSYQQVLKTALHDIEIVPFSLSKGERFEEAACTVIQSPNYFGKMEVISEIPRLVFVGDPLSFSYFKSPGECGADVAVGELQSLGIPLSFGGPYAGYMAVKKEYMRFIPGRIVGKTKDLQGRDGYTLTLQTREQHIRREKATSNICTNQTLMAITAVLFAYFHGAEGLRKLALECHEKAQYLKNKLSSFLKVDSNMNFHEFLIFLPIKASLFLEKMRAHHILAGIEVGEKTVLVSVTETKSLHDLDCYVDHIKKVLK